MPEQWDIEGEGANKLTPEEGGQPAPRPDREKTQGATNDETQARRED